jgi:putative FmdB family regulatory protein
MPTYEYECTSCGVRSEVVQRFSDDPLTTCSACGGPLRKVFSAVGVVFKGSGFYKTDSRSTKSASTPPASAPAASESSSSSESTTAPSTATAAPAPSSASSSSD